jgi:hypothetical protein
MPGNFLTLRSSSADLLAKLCGMFGSDHPGERANAAARADALVRSAGLTWRDIIHVPDHHHHHHRGGYEDGGDGGHYGHYDNRDWRAAREFCLRYPGRLRPREYNFVINLGSWRGPLTARQEDWLTSIFMRLQREAAL